jgi:lipoate-protein ligase A
MRLILSGDGPPAFNLALDEALLRSGVPTLRLYGWDPPGLSLGFFQRGAEFAGTPGYQLVRRPTGGGAILHENEVTIAWIGVRCRVERAYEIVNAMVAAALRSFHIEVRPGTEQPEAAPAGLCFDAHTCYDLIAGNRKLFGSAQRRAGPAFLLHGTLVLGSIPRDEMERALVEAAPWPLEPGEPTKSELAHARRLVSKRYGNDAWTLRR